MLSLTKYQLLSNFLTKSLLFFLSMICFLFKLLLETNYQAEAHFLLNTLKLNMKLNILFSFCFKHLKLTSEGKVI